ncbi:molybdenum cofactor sulfurylase [Oceanicola sp. 22II-s10i]|uniref:xanthine dehydrogenase accessory protein XdhC n=1 Tax=Oceanicola sp. 22II-s10i TaxID=1317116 RepID=UPI000B51F92F|nr:xanthine dehydrogenase accessory protein XdhC [Oceanicola sp. 22II-s10i]OWU84592.1 molybdenum cofactor sulfurylase [Oceanicola sp. 22II-s10i]
MAFELDLLRRRVAAEGRVVRVVIAEVRGSSPREPGAAMIVGPAGTDGTIGGGALEFEAMRDAADVTAPRVVRRALGPELGQCCGGSVTLVYEPVDAEVLNRIEGAAYCRQVSVQAGEMPLSMRRALAAMRSEGRDAPVLCEGGWLLEPVAGARRDLWIWGAGHVGRALVSVLAPLPDVAITWVDTAASRFPDAVPAGVEMVPAADPALLAAHAPETAEHLILTYSHAIDLALCDALLTRGFARAGLIGSATKWARFRKRLAGMGHPDARISRIDCPIGDPALGKHPQAIAVGVAARLLMVGTRQETARDISA